MQRFATLPTTETGITAAKAEHLTGRLAELHC